MPWTNKQKQIAARACQAAGISEEQRRDMILRNFANARLPDGRISSTSPKLTNSDFENFMAVVEQYAGGKVLHFTPGYWQGQASDALARMRHRATSLAELLERDGHLAPNGAGLAGWIRKRVSQGQADRVEELDYSGLDALIRGLTAFARRAGLDLPGQAKGAA